ncbi:hypothetical protein P4637_12610 [Halalkalibacterium halodurans]|nr:hypothetical protein [Halalkalibacterium halodurans]MED4080658.1 hypothetical protein [Halalkalibacterium halodurans]MED4085655.1 hypothetical protein [Halalkalibacterium halodurans]MED4106345.1 hypothetical protein [Halalkalibacterium halodurans]MED4108541.1 hypothetical protein [Halalkalibacterium halodurans]MED4124757.1 hypothetical protein [Halalkalibacterium halodurans]
MAHTRLHACQQNIRRTGQSIRLCRTLRAEVRADLRQCRQALRECRQQQP